MQEIALAEQDKQDRQQQQAIDETMLDESLRQEADRWRCEGERSRDLDNWEKHAQYEGGKQSALPCRAAAHCSFNTAIAANVCAGSQTHDEMAEEEIADGMLRDIVCSEHEWHEAHALSEEYGIEKQRMTVILENWAQSGIVEWGRGEGGRDSARLKQS